VSEQYHDFLVQLDYTLQVVEHKIRKIYAFEQFFSGTVEKCAKIAKKHI